MRGQQVLEIGQRTALGRGDGLAADQVLQQRNGIGGHVLHGTEFRAVCTNKEMPRSYDAGY
jgi:hypothetical protein